jgi:hypothetical protein
MTWSWYDSSGAAATPAVSSCGRRGARGAHELTTAPVAARAQGGASCSHVRLLRTRDGVVLQFAGAVSAAHGGGFASARSRDADPPWDLRTFDGVRLRVRGDGQRYKCARRARAARASAPAAARKRARRAATRIASAHA